MAQVWLARLRGKREFEKLYAIKTIKTELGEDARFQEMFLDEARIASGIEHPNVAHLLDLGEQDGILYIVMEWVDGESLAKVARQARKLDTPLPLPLALRIMADACAGLHAAHELKDRAGENLGVVHRDVSPQNILVATNGAVKVIDFGVAKARNRKAGETGAGIVKGKIRFMAPEQVRAQPLDRRADIWAAGVCLCELATGRLPFDDDSDVDVVRRLISDEPPPGFEDVPGPVAEILAHSLVRNIEERFATAAAMRRAIEVAMQQLKMQAASDDIADFVRANLPEFAEKRHTVMSKAMADADERAAARGSVSAIATGADTSDAYAATVVSKAGTNPDERVTVKPAPAKAMPSARALLEGRVPADESVGGAFTEEEVAALPKKRGVLWVLAFAAICAGAWFGWPGGPRIRGMVAQWRGPQTLATAAPTSSASSAPSTSSIASASAAPSTSVVELATDASAPSASASTHASHPHVGSQDVTFSPAPVQPTITAPTETVAPPPPPPPTQTQPPAPTAPPPEENNPY
jgi:serine/threonine-protein kinase